MSAVSKKEILRKTIVALERSYQRHPENDNILQQLALAYIQAGAFNPRAVEIYNLAASRIPGDMKIQRAVSMSFLVSQSRSLVQDLTSLDQLDRESLGRSIAKLRELSKVYSDSPEIHCALGDLLLLLGEERGALQHYRIAIALGLEDLEPLVTHFEHVRLLGPMNTAVVVFFCELYQRLGRDDRADSIYRQLVSENDGDPLALDAYRSFLERRVEQMTEDEEGLGEAMRQLIRVALLQDHEQEALAWARQTNPQVLAKSPPLVRDLARVLIDMEDYRQAFEYLALVPLDFETRTLFNEMSVRLEKAGEIDAAVFLLKYMNDNEARLAQQEREEEERRHHASQQREVEIATELSLAELHWKNRRWAAAFQSYIRVLELGYEDYRSLLEPIEALLERVPHPEPEPLAFLTNFFAERKDWRRVLRLADLTLRAQPGLTNISQRMMQACEQILLQDPDASDVRLRLADLHLERNNIERAMQEYRRAAAVPEYSMKAKRRLAFALMKAGDSTGALEQFKSLAVLDPEDIERLYDLLIRLSSAELYKEAIEAGQLIIEYDRKFRDVAPRLEHLEARLKALGEAFAIDPKMRELIGEHAIGRYKYIGKVGSGGMGVVHRVLDLKNDQELAMKILREGLSGSGRALDRFFREARIASTLRHRNIVRIVDYNISNNPGQSYIAMEFIDGPSLRDVIERKFSESMDLTHGYLLQALDWMSQLCDALDCTHKKGIIHRDIKPDNILIAPGDVVKVTDFGIVHVEEATFTPTGALIGTPRYMSPEQVHGGRIDGRSDIYSVGIIFYETLIGSPPFISGDIAYQQVNVLPTRPIEISSQIPAQIDRIIMKCLEKSANDRYQEALELKAAIDETYIRMGGDPERRRPSNTSADITRENLPKLPPPTGAGIPPSIAAQLTPAAITGNLPGTTLPVRSPLDKVFSEQITDANEDQRRTDTQRKLDLSPLDGDLD